MRIHSDLERMQSELDAYSQININGNSYDIVNGHFYIDGRYGYSIDQRICDDDENGNCQGITN